MFIYIKKNIFKQIFVFIERFFDQKLAVFENFEAGSIPFSWASCSLTFSVE